MHSNDPWSLSWVQQKVFSLCFRSIVLFPVNFVSFTPQPGGEKERETCRFLRVTLRERERLGERHVDSCAYVRTSDIEAD